MELFTTCPRKSLFAYVLRRTLHPKSALKYGSAIHSALEFYYKHKDQHANEEDLFQHLKEIVEDDYQNELLDPSEWRTPTQAQKTLQLYINKWRTDHLRLLDLNGSPAVELPFSLPLCTLEYDSAFLQPIDSIPPEDYFTRIFGTPLTQEISRIYVFWTGKIDLLVRESTDNWVVDHKTTSIIGEAYWKQYELSTPAIGYVWAAEQLTHLQFSGLWINAIIGRRPTATGRAIEFERRRFLYPRHRIDEFSSVVSRTIADFIDNLIRGDFPPYFKWCVSQYGACPYHEICSLKPSSRIPALFSSPFQNNTWSPLD